VTTKRDLFPEQVANRSIETRLRRSFAATCILGLVGFGLYGAWLTRGHVGNILGALVATLLPATAYTLGYFHRLPEALGAMQATQKRTLWQRWSDFARLSAFFAICLTLLWGIDIKDDLFSRNLLGKQWSDAINILLGVLLTTSLMAACVVASEEYLARTMDRGNTAGISGWRSSARRLVGSWGAAILKPLRAKRSLSLGSVLALASLFLNSTAEFGCGTIPHKGYEIVSGKAAWVTAQSVEQADKLQAVVAQAGRWMYSLGLVLALVVLAAVLAGSAGDALRRSRAIMVLAGSLAVFFLCDYTLAWVYLADTVVPKKLTFAVRAAVWIVPISLWLWRARGDAKSWDRTRLAVTVLYLPIFFASFFLLVGLFSLGLEDILGYISLLVGMLLIWWGLVQSQWEAYKP